jgi:hypothetical protein
MMIMIIMAIMIMIMSEWPCAYTYVFGRVNYNVANGGLANCK